jgi:hypothetical protein
MHTLTANQPTLSLPTAAIKRKLGQLGQVCFFIYFYVAALIACPYYNWQYAKQNGFASWIVLGQIVPTAKALAWPYFAVASRVADGSVDPHFKASSNATGKALLLVNEAGGITELTPEQSGVIADLLETAVAEADLVSDGYLAEIHPDFPHKYRKCYSDSLRALADGLRTGSGVKQVFAATAFDNFTAWVKANKIDF